MRIEDKHIIADEGKVLIRITTGEIFGDQIYLGYSHYIGGVLQVPPHLDVPEDFEEIEMEESDEMPEFQEEVID